MQLHNWFSDIQSSEVHAIICKQAPPSIMRDLHRGHAALRRGRISIPGAEYFVTICTDERHVGLTEPSVAAAILREMHAMECDATWRIRCAVVMPDHIHLLMILGERLSLGKSLARLKSKSVGSSTVAWERDFFDRHIRPDDDRLALFLYVYLNPYRSGLCARDELWPWYFCCEEDMAWFRGYLDEDRPPPEWLQNWKRG